MKKKILIAALNWGLGHATRCIPIINALIHYGYDPVIASDGRALALLRKEFPQLPFETLPAYGISYPKHGTWLKWKLLADAPSILKAVKRERHFTETLVKKYQLSGILSDNRLGVYSASVPSVYLTHQLQVLSGSTTFLSSKIHQRFIKRFTACWVPDSASHPQLSGALGHSKGLKLPVTYIGALSRLKKQDCQKRYQVLILLSGPEPQRQYLEEELLEAFKSYDAPVLVVRGVIEEEQTVCHRGPFTIYNFMQTADLQQAINSSALVVSRSGYTTIVDLASLNKKAFFIPTPGQFEQDYLAKRFQELGVAPYCKQGAFSPKALERINAFRGFESLETTTDFKALFRLF
mgnify:CR=1 FL=1